MCLCLWLEGQPFPEESSIFLPPLSSTFCLLSCKAHGLEWLDQTKGLGVGVYTGSQRVGPGVCSLLSSQHPIVLSPVWAPANAELRERTHVPTVGRSSCDPAGEREALQDWLPAQNRSHPAPNLPVSETAKRTNCLFP